MTDLDKKIIRVKQVSELTGLSRTSIYRLSSFGQFPKSIKLSAYTTGWLVSEVEAWLDSKIQARDAEV
ncbi:helix-turn-helix transcriptional regulator [Francisella uliginis]|uniref:AlpA family transcriptional regulator n=1 Tax=Francisella uliginis TaxID=573570 RepID=A0A1L4BPT3_9GAMM|nr:AlpA family transcriptional regulator [Francisella uliginis]API85847.1 hypothetical protein F7310_00080 [Francisella uliginis]